MFGRDLSTRERRTVRAGAAVAAVALLTAFVVLPVARHWSTQRSALGVARDRVQRLQGLIRDSAALAAEATAREETRVRAAVRVIRARTPALAASTLQSLLQELATRSRVSITQLNVAAVGDSAGVVPTVPASLSAVTDIYGVADFLTRLRQGNTLLDVREIHVSSTSGLRGDLLQLALTIHAPYLVEP
jgi:type II secretory pathway component PulM